MADHIIPVRRSSSGYNSLHGSEITWGDIPHSRRLSFYWGRWKYQSKPISLSRRHLLPPEIRNKLDEILTSYVNFNPWKHMKHDVFIGTYSEGGEMKVKVFTNHVRICDLPVTCRCNCKCRGRYCYCVGNLLPAVVENHEN